jgi:hypothetical protein
MSYNDITHLTTDRKYNEALYLAFMHYLSFKMLMFRTWQEIEK